MQLHRPTLMPISFTPLRLALCASTTMIFFSQTLRFYAKKQTGGNVSNMLRVFFAAALCATALIGNVVPSALAGPYPNGPITLVNPYAAGGPADVLARTIID